MPDFYIDDLDISPSEFVYACSDHEILELIEVLKEDGYLNNIFGTPDGPQSVNDEMFFEAMAKIAQSKHMLTNEEEEIIKTIANRL